MGEQKRQIRIKRLHPKAVLPTRATNESAGFDLYTIETKEINPIPGGVTLRTGIAIELPPGLEMQVRGRSGLAFREDILLHVGTIDSDFRGEILVKLWNLGPKPVQIHQGERIAQGVIHALADTEMLEVQELEASQRGEGGFGHTGR